MSRRLRTAAVPAAVLTVALTCGTAAADVSPAPTQQPQLPNQAANTEPIGGPRMGESGLVVAPGALPLPSVTAATWLVADAKTGAVLAASNPHGKRRPASTLKTLNALTMAPRLSDTMTYTAQPDDEQVEGTRVGMLSSQTYSVRDLWYALWLRSANDAANGIAKAGGDGTVETGVRMMQAEAVRLQALDTTVKNPSGLDADGQYSSAYDLALWGRAALQRGDLREYMGTLRRQFPGNLTKTGNAKTSKPFWIYTTNRLMGKYDGLVGVKNGFTTFARNTLIVAAERDGRTIMATLMGTPGGVYDEAAKLMDWGFSTPADAPSVGQLVDPISTAVVGPDDVAGTAGEQAAGIFAASATGALGSAPAAHATDLRLAAAGGAAAVVLFFGVLATRRRIRRPRLAR